MNLLCKIFNHKWKYNFPTLPSRRSCVRCKLKQRADYSGDIMRDGEKWVGFLKEESKDVLLKKKIKKVIK